MRACIDTHGNVFFQKNQKKNLDNPDYFYNFATSTRKKSIFILFIKKIKLLNIKEMKRLNYQNSLIVKDITGSVKVMELLPVCTGNLDDPNWLYLTCMGTNEIAKFVKTSISYLIPTEFTYRKNRISDTRVNFLCHDHNGDLIIRFCLDCQDTDVMDEAAYEVEKTLYLNSED